MRLYALFVIFISFLMACAPSGEIVKSTVKAKKSCLDCHKDYYKLVRKNGRFLHQPVNEGDCKKCHRTHGLIGGAFLKLKEPTLCLICHKKIINDAQSKNVHLPFKRGKCKTCHYPHSSSNKFLLKKSSNDLCLSCRKNIISKNRFLHNLMDKYGLNISDKIEFVDKHNIQHKGYIVWSDKEIIISSPY